MTRRDLLGMRPQLGPGLRQALLFAVSLTACDSTAPSDSAEAALPDSVAAVIAAVGNALGHAESLSAAIQQNPAAVSLGVLQYGLTLGGQSPTALGGNTFSFYPEYGSYAEDPSLTGAPANTVRFVLYRTTSPAPAYPLPPSDFVVQPLQPVGHADLVSEPGLDTVLTVRALAEGSAQAELRASGFTYLDSTDSGRDSTRLTVSGTLRLDNLAAPTTARIEVRGERHDREYDVALQRARVTVRAYYLMYRRGKEGGGGRVRIAFLDDANVDSTVVEVVYTSFRHCGGVDGFLRLNGDSAARVMFSGSRFVVYGDTITAARWPAAFDTMSRFWTSATGCGLPETLRSSVDALLSPAVFALRQLAAPRGDLRVAATTTGPGNDPDGYVVVAPEWKGPLFGTPFPPISQSFRWMRLSPNATVTIPGWPAGRFWAYRTVTLNGLAPNCTPDGTNFRTVTIPIDGTADLGFAVTCQVSPLRTGELLVTQERRPYSRTYDLFVVDANGTNLRRLAANTDSAEVWWSPDGTRIALLRRVRGDTLEAAIMMGSDITRLGARSGRDREVRWSPDGTRLAVTSVPAGLQHPDIFVVTADGASEANITRSPNGPDWAPAWAPDGSRIAFLSTFQSSHVYAMSPDGTDLKRLASFTEIGARGHLAWSPDGRRLLVEASTRASGLSEIFVMNADGTGLTNLSQVSSGGSATYPSDAAPRWSPDGSRILFQRAGQVYAMNADGTNLKRLSKDGGGAAEWAPDGAQIAFVGPAGLTFADTTGTWNLAAFGISPVQIRWRPGRP